MQHKKSSTHRGGKRLVVVGPNGRVGGRGNKEGRYSQQRDGNLSPAQDRPIFFVYQLVQLFLGATDGQVIVVVVVVVIIGISIPAFIGQVEVLVGRYNTQGLGRILRRFVAGLELARQLHSYEEKQQQRSALCLFLDKTQPQRETKLV
jgi:hypothetical protein